MTRGAVRSLLAIAAFLAAMALLPTFVKSEFWLTFLILALYTASLGQAWNVLGGFGGQYSFGHAMFFGVGAYAAAVLQVRFGINPWVTLGAAFALGGVAFSIAMGCIGFVGTASYQIAAALILLYGLVIWLDSSSLTAGAAGTAEPSRRGATLAVHSTLGYAGGFKESVQRVVELEKAGLDQVWVAEAYSFDAISQVGYLAAMTNRIEIGTGIVNVYSRSAALMAMTAAGCDYVSDGRFILGLGASGPQVIEGFHGIPYEKPMQRIKEYIEVCRKVWAREEALSYDGKTVQVPLPAGQGTGLGKALKLINHPVRKDIPIWWASLKERAVEATAQSADGWLPIMFIPEMFQKVWGGPLKAGTAKRDASRKRLDISAGGILCIDDSLDQAGEDVGDRVLAEVRREIGDADALVAVARRRHRPLRRRPGVAETRPPGYWRHRRRLRSLSG